MEYLQNYDPFNNHFLSTLAAAAQNWGLRQNTVLERVLWLFAGMLLVFPSLIEGLAEQISGYDVPHPAPLGLAIGVALLLKQLKPPFGTTDAAKDSSGRS